MADAARKDGRAVAALVKRYYVKGLAEIYPEIAEQIQVVRSNYREENAGKAKAAAVKRHAGVKSAKEKNTIKPIGGLGKGAKTVLKGIGDAVRAQTQQKHESDDQ